jgi:hypothetical protein
MLNEGYQRHNFILCQFLIHKTGYYEIIAMLSEKRGPVPDQHKRFEFKEISIRKSPSAEIISKLMYLHGGS